MAQNFIARIMTECIVNSFEMVYIQQKHAKCMSVANCPVYLACQLALEPPAVRQPRQVVRKGRFLATIQILPEINQGTRSSEQQPQVGWVSEIAQGPGLAPAKHILCLVIGGRLYNYRHEPRPRVAANRTGKLEAVHARHPHVRDDKVGLL